MMILIHMVDKLSDDITLKNVVILMTCFIKDAHIFYPQQEALYDK